MRDLGLVYGAFDFVITPEAEWIFLEVNPGGQFGFLEDSTDAPLTATLADLLAQEAP
jgi:D-alanine-D-alanine ligase-like ATP-grasp enzyme